MNIGEKLNQVKVSQLMLKLPVIALSVLTHTAAMAQSSSTSTSKAAAGTSTVTAETIKPKVNKFGFTYVNYTANSFAKAKTEGGADTLNIMTLTYKYSDDWKLGFAMANDYKIPGSQDKKGNYAVYRDAGFAASTTYGSLLGTEKTPVKYTVYVPNSQRSKDAKQAFSTSAAITLGYDLTEKISATSILIPMIYVRNGADQLRHRYIGTLQYAFTPKFNTNIYVDHDMMALTNKSLDKSYELLSLGVGVGYSPTETIDLGLSVSRDRYLSVSDGENASIQADPNSKFSFLDERELSYTAEATLKF